jgi:hypothetical protein
MAVLVTAIHDGVALRSVDGHEYHMQGGSVYIMTNRPNGTLYIA